MAAAVGAVVWVAREAMRRWVDGPEAPQVAGSWRTEPGSGGERAPLAGGPVERKAPADPVATGDGPAARGTAPAAATDTTGATASAVATAADNPAAPPAKTSSPGSPAKKAAAPKKAPAAKTGPSVPAKAAKKSARRSDKAAQPSGPPAWVAPNGSGEAPDTHPVKAKLLNHLYRVPGMPMYNRMVADRCYPDPESAEADGFKRAAR